MANTVPATSTNNTTNMRSQFMKKLSAKPKVYSCNAVAVKKQSRKITSSLRLTGGFKKAFLITDQVSRKVKG